MCNDKQATKGEMIGKLFQNRLVRSPEARHEACRCRPIRLD